ncbi:maleylpyruvate isomerase family mycothiol-dependent enzyme [Sphaerisporangium sp. NPDC051011]|uniref:maleylpyruvate isomerase family mycothiol-dependent enzyme n=1 Tax=Sphaerisporangium sp. NPDC051011 TaxID=3155792 RepID=UPI0033E60090
MVDSFVPAARLPHNDRGQVAAIAEAEGHAAIALLGELHDDDWQRPTDCVEWDVRTLVSHLVAQCEDNIHLRTMLRRQFLGRRRHPGKIALDGHMAVQVEDHAGETGPALVDSFALLWPRAVRARLRTPNPMRRFTIDTGMPGAPRLLIGHLLDVIYTRDLWMHRVDLARAMGRPITIGDHDRRIVEQVIRDMALAWTAAPIALELTGPAGGSWVIGSGAPTAVIRTDAVAYMRALAGRDDDVTLELVSGPEVALTFARQARVIF